MLLGLVQTIDETGGVPGDPFRLPLLVLYRVDCPKR
jgi:hypothetical protein